MAERLEKLAAVRRWCPVDWERVNRTIALTVSLSFKDDSRMTGAEVKRRATLCTHAIEEALERGIILERVLDTLGQRLRAKLDGVEVLGDERRVWAPETQEKLVRLN